MRVGARKGCKEHLERSESASYNNIYNTYTHLFYIWWPLPQNNSKKKGEDLISPFYYMRPATPYIRYCILYIHRREAAHSSKLCVILITPKIKNAIPLRAYASKPVITHPQEKNMQRIAHKTPKKN